MGGKAEAMFMEGPFRHQLAMKKQDMPNIGAAFGGTGVQARSMPNIGAALGGSGTEGGGLHGADLREHFGHRGAKPGGFSGDLLGHARNAGLIGGAQKHEVSGSASLSV